jgi:hypothetical protein
MIIASANGHAGFRRRVIGTGEMVSTIEGGSSAENRLGYFFWSSGNAASFTATNGKYLTLNGVDPLANSYSVTNGVFPTSAAGTLGNVTFAGLNAGDYAAWSALRLVSQSPTPAGVTAVIAAAQTLTSTQHDFVTLPNLKVWHSHFPISSIAVTTAANGPTLNPATPGDLCATSGALAEVGGDAGGSNVQKAANADFCADYASTVGFIDLNN